jgi:hypothetical protein
MPGFERQNYEIPQLWMLTQELHSLQQEGDYNPRVPRQDGWQCSKKRCLLQEERNFVEIRNCYGY